MSGCRGEKTGCPCPLAGAPRLQPGKETDFQLVTVELSSRRVRRWYCDSLGGIPVFFPPMELKSGELRHCCEDYGYGYGHDYDYDCDCDFHKRLSRG